MPARRLYPELEGHAAQDERDQHQRDFQVQRRQDDAVRMRECHQQDSHTEHQPGFVCIPEGADRGHHHVLLLARGQRQQDPHSEVETVEDDVGEYGKTHQRHEDQRQIELHGYHRSCAPAGWSAAGDVCWCSLPSASLSASWVSTTMYEINNSVYTTR